MQTSSQIQSSPIPVTVFTGFLGAGKTSIILSLLPRVPKGYKLCLLKNEFGDVKGKKVY
jgi:G3E family GTPase